MAPHDVIVLAVMVKHAMTHLDGVEILLSAGAVLESHVSLRAFWESSLYVEWVLESDSDTRARQFYVAHMRQRREWARRVASGTAERSR